MTRKLLALCENCGTPYAGFVDADGEILVEGGPACGNCGGTSIRELSKDEVGGDEDRPLSA